MLKSRRVFSIDLCKKFTSILMNIHNRNLNEAQNHQCMHFNGQRNKCDFFSISLTICYYCQRMQTFHRNCISLRVQSLLHIIEWANFTQLQLLYKDNDVVGSQWEKENGAILSFIRFIWIQETISILKEFRIESSFFLCWFKVSVEWKVKKKLCSFVLLIWKVPSLQMVPMKGRIESTVNKVIWCVKSFICDSIS